MLNVNGKLKNSYMMRQQNEFANLTLRKAKSVVPEVYSHLLIAKIKDTKIMFSFFIEAAIVEETVAAIS